MLDVKKILRAIRLERIALATALVLVFAALAVYSDEQADSGGAQAAGGHGDMPMVMVPAAAMIPTSQRLDRTGWTATASDQETAYENGRASNVLDGSPTTLWHSQWSGSSAAGFPHTITIDMQKVQDVSALVYLPRPDGGNGAIGQYEIRLSTDGTTFGNPVVTGTWADDAAEKSASFGTKSARYVRLTALTEAGNRGPWSAAAEIDMLGAPTDVGDDVQLPRTGWTIKASDQETAQEPGAASRAIDGDIGTFWHSSWSSPFVPLPHSLTVTLPQLTTVSGLRYLPRTDPANGRIGDYRIETSTDGSTFTQVAAGTFPDSAAEQTVTFARTKASAVRLVATSEAGNRGGWSTVSELNLIGVDPNGTTSPSATPTPTATTSPTPTATTTPTPTATTSPTATATPTATPTGSVGSLGKWSAVTGLPLVPSSAALLPGNKLLVWSGVKANDFGMGEVPKTEVAIVDLSTGKVSARTVVETNHEMFCTGTSMLPDGRILITGGSSSGATTIYNPANDTWTAGPKLNIPRGYQSDVTLSTGQVFTLGGSWNGGQGGKDGEVFTPNGSWKRLSGVTANRILTDDKGGIYRSDNHAWLFSVANGGVFQAGPSKQMNWISTSGDGSMTAAGNRAADGHSMNGNAVMYDVGKILTVGGSPDYDDSDATTNAHTIDISGGLGSTPTVTKVGSMASARAFHNSVVLPDGKVVVVGGQAHAKVFTDTTSAMSPEIWDPATGAFSTMAPMAVPRNYHSVALLLPDGRVWSGGGGQCGLCATNHPDGQIFTPPYLLNADGSARTRPTITSAPTSARPGAKISVSTGSTVASFSLVRQSTVTHSINTDQRRIPLARGTRSGSTYSVQLPSSTGTLVPGNYMLFAMSSNGTPSLARIINIR